MIPFDESDEQLDTYFHDCRSKAEKLFSEKVPYIAYKVYGSSIECDSMYRYYPMTDETIEIIKKLQEPDPEQSISYLLETNGCDNLVKEFEGEDGFWVYTIDWTPRRIYSFSIVEYSKFSYKSSPKQEVFIYLEDEEYIQLLCNRIMCQDFNFNNLVA